jgi:hypothetical protein
MLLSEALVQLPMDVINKAAGKGWEVYGDSAYTVGSPLVIANTTAQLTCDGLASSTNTSEKPFGANPLWNTTTNKLNPVSVGDAYDLRVQFKAKVNANTAHFDFELDIGGSLGVIFSRTLNHTKGVNAEGRYSIGVPIFALATFLANGGAINIDSTQDGATVSIYDIQIFEKLDYAGNGTRT